MISIHASLDVVPTTQSTDTGGLVTRGHIGTTMAALGDLFGEPAEVSAAGLGTWLVDTPAGRARLDASTGTFADTGCWLILADSDHVLPWIYKIVTGSTVGFPAGAPPYFTESTVATFTAAYADYLYLRMLAAHNAPDVPEGGWQDRRRRRIHVDQLNHNANDVRAALHHYQWSQASTGERQAWASMARPAEHHGQDPLARWHQIGRWLYRPIRTRRHPQGGDPDLAGMLSSLADTAARFRADLVDHNPDLDFEFHDEHTATLHALAHTAVPGLDSLTRLAP